jgi:hypothetical protein
LGLISGGPLRHERWNALFVAVLLIFPSLIWGWRDRHLWLWDQAWYGEVAADLAFRLGHDHKAWLAGMREFMPSKPPLLPWIGQLFTPLGLILGDMDFALLLVNLIAQAVTVAFVWRIAREAARNRPLIAVAAALFVASAPLFVGMSHQFLTEPLQTTIVAGSFFLAWAAPRIDSNRLVLCLLMAVVAGAAVKTTTPAYAGLAWSWIVWELRGRLLRNARWPALTAVDALLGTAVVVVAYFTLAWYVRNLPDVLGHIADATTSDVADAYGHRGAFIEKFLFWSRAQATSFSLQPILLIAAAWLIGVAFVVRFVWRSEASAFEPAGRLATLALLAFLHIVAFTSLLAAQVNEDTRFLAPLLPCCAILLTWGLAQVRSAALGAVAAGVVALVAFTQFAMVHLEAHGLIARRTQSAWLLPVSVTRDQEVADDLVRDTCPADYKWHSVVVGPERPTLNANSLAYVSAERSLSAGYRCYYWSLGYAEKDVERALRRIDDLGARYVILPQPANIEDDPNFLNQALKGVEERIRLGNRFTALPGMYSGYKIYRRTE